MPSRPWLLLGTALLYAGGLATPAVCDERQLTERLNRQQLEYRVMPRANPYRRIVWVRRWVWDNFWGDYHLQWVPRSSVYREVSYVRSTHKMRTPAISASGKETVQPISNGASDETVLKSDKQTRTASLDMRNKPAQTLTKTVTNAGADLTKPLTPAQIRAAVPLGKVQNPKQTLASTPIRSIWGDALGKVRDMDVSGGGVKTVVAELGKDAVKIDAARLKYVTSRNLLITTLSKSDVEKLPKADHS